MRDRTLSLTLLFLTALILLPSAGAVTLSGAVRFNQSMEAGGSASVDMVFIPDAGKVTTFEGIMVSGDCAPWITVNRSSMTFNRSAGVRAVIAVPPGASNGIHRCDIEFLQPPEGMIRPAIGFPITVKVLNGTEPQITLTTTATPATTSTPPETRTTYAPINPGIVLAALAAIAVWRRRP